MACSLEKVSDPSLTATFIEPYLKSHITDDYESTVSRVLTAYSVDSLKIGLQSLRKQKESLVTNEHAASVRENGFISPVGLYTPVLGGNGLLTISINYYPVGREKYEVMFFEHARNKITMLGYFPECGFYERYEYLWNGPRTPCLLCGLTQDGNHVVLLGPIRYTQYLQLSPNSDIPVIAIYQLAPPMQLLEKHFEDTPFIKCDPIAVALSPPSVMQGQYQVAVVTYKMAIIVLNVATLERSTLQLESVRPQVYKNLDIYENCATFSLNGRFLSVSCYMENESVNACLIIGVGTLEPLCWMAADRGVSWLQWLFPMFSACGTKLVFSTYSDSENINDESKYELMFYNISTIRSLKVLCRVVILECVRPTLLDQLPLPQDMISFLDGSRPTQMSADTQPSELCSEESTTCRCNLL